MRPYAELVVPPVKAAPPLLLLLLPVLLPCVAAVVLPVPLPGRISNCLTLMLS
jgi:hypothetical protein